MSLTTYYTPLLCGFVLYMYCIVVKSPCRKINVMNSHTGILYWLMYIMHVIRNVDDPTKSLHVFRIRFLSLEAGCFWHT